MAGWINRIWVRFALAICATVIITVSVLGLSMSIFAEYQYRRFYTSLPVALQQEMDQLNAADMDDSPRALEIYTQYWNGDVLFGERWALIIGLLVCLPIGIALAFWFSRIVTLPLNSIAEAANRIALGDLSVRAEGAKHRGEMADMVRDFNRMTDALDTLERERRATAAALSHELRTPLAVLTARLHALCDGVIDPSSKELDRLLNHVQHLSRLVDDMHTLSMADAGRLSLVPVDVDLATFAREVIDTFASRSANFSATMQLDVQAKDLIVFADPDRLRQVLSNLLDNALRYGADGAEGIEGSEGGQVIVTISREDREAILVVADNGPGLPEDVMEHLFEHFHRSDSSRSRATGGSGLGLAIVHALVTGMAGKVSASVSPAGGAMFTVRLPLRADQ